MPNFTSSPNMLMPIPTVGVDPGPDWANNINSSLSIIDQHNHASGSGVQITPSGLNINADFPMGSNNITLARSLRFQAQSSPLAVASDLACIYASGVDLYYNDGNGNQIRITQSGGIAGTSGSISNLTSPASASYVAGSGTFVWQSAANTAANMDGASVLLRNTTANSKALTLNPPSAMGSNYSLVLPPLPASQKFMTLDASGNITAPWAVDNSTVEIASSTTLQIKDVGVTTAKIADAAITTAKIADLNVTTTKLAASAVTTAKITDGNVSQVKLYTRTVPGTTATAGNVAIQSGATGSYSSGTPTTILEIGLVTTGRPVMIQLIAATSGSPASLGSASTASGTLWIYRDSSPIFTTTFGANGFQQYTPIYNFMDQPSAANHDYQVRVSSDSPGNAIFWNNLAVIAYEI